MAEALGDLAERIARKFDADTAAPVAEAETLTEEAALDAVENDLAPKIRFTWKPEDRVILERIRGAAEAMFDEAFAESIAVIDQFYLALRTPRLRDGVVVLDARGRTVWETDESDTPIERWSQLTGQDLEYTLANLARLRFTVSSQINQLYLEALYARYTASDAFDEAWGKVSETEGKPPTQGDRQAKSNLGSRQDRYFAFFKYYLYRTANTFLSDLDRFSKLLTDVRYWQVRSQRT